ncbi:MAG: peroxiredoxin-like family protein [Pseudomonadota bacterium]
MSDITPVLPRQAAPTLDVSTVGGGTWSLDQQSPENFTLVVFYRGLHCPICKMQLNDLQNKLDDFDKRGVNVIAVSSDTKERAEETAQSWGLDRLTLGYGIDLQTARNWGLYVSAGKGKTSIGVEEPALFSEPGLFLIKPDGSVYFASVQTMPFARPHFADILGAIDFVVKNGYPARGEIEALAQAAE